MSGGDREGERERTAEDVSRQLDGIETGASEESRDGAWRVPVDWPGGARHEGGASPVCGFCMERGKASADTARPLRRTATGSASGGRNREALSTVAALAGGPARSSGEAPVMGVERRGRVIKTSSHEQPGSFREETRGQVRTIEQVV